MIYYMPTTIYPSVYQAGRTFALRGFNGAPAPADDPGSGGNFDEH